jgi:hypothetical protein
VSAKNQYRSHRNFFDGLDKDCAAPAQLIHDVPIVNNFVMNVDGIAVGFQRQFDNVHGANDSCAKSARTDAHQRLGAVIGSMNGRQRQSNLRKALLFYLNGWFPATSFAFVVLSKNGNYFWMSSRRRIAASR